MERINVSTGTRWEPAVGYSRAVRVGPTVCVTGTIAVDERGGIVGRGDAEAQARVALERVGAALAACGAEWRHVVRTRLYVTDIDDWEAVGRAHASVFGEIRPATTMVEVSRLVIPEALVEIEADAVIAETTSIRTVDL